MNRGPLARTCKFCQQLARLNLLECGVAHKKLPAVPRFPAALVKDLAAPHLGTLAATHVRALRLSLLLVAATRWDTATTLLHCFCLSNMCFLDFSDS